MYITIQINTIARIMIPILVNKTNKSNAIMTGINKISVLQVCTKNTNHTKPIEFYSNIIYYVFTTHSGKHLRPDSINIVHTNTGV